VNSSINICTNSSSHILTNNKLVFFREIVLWHLQVQRSRTLSYTAGDIVVRTVARAEPTTKVTCLTNRDTTQMCADSQHDKPFGLLHSVSVGLRIAESFDPATVY